MTSSQNTTKSSEIRVKILRKKIWILISEDYIYFSSGRNLLPLEKYDFSLTEFGSGETKTFPLEEFQVDYILSYFGFFYLKCKFVGFFLTVLA